MTPGDYARCKGAVRDRLMAIEAEAKAARQALEIDQWVAVEVGLSSVSKLATEAARANGVLLAED